jgi:hypothetical protein
MVRLSQLRYRVQHEGFGIARLQLFPGRGANRSELKSLALGEQVATGHSVLISGAIGAASSGSPALCDNTSPTRTQRLYQRVPQL